LRKPRPLIAELKVVSTTTCASGMEILNLQPKDAKTRPVENAEIVMKEWIETAKELGRPIPEPKGRLIFA